MTDVLAGGPRPAHSTVDGSPFPPIAEYAFLSDCEVCALVAPSGERAQCVLHLPLINAAMHLIREDERRCGGAMSAGPDLHAGGRSAGQDHSTWTGQ